MGRLLQLKRRAEMPEIRRVVTKKTRELIIGSEEQM